MGKPVADRIGNEVMEQAEMGDELVLSVYLIGDDRSSEIYASSKVRKGEHLGIRVDLKKFGPDVDLEDLEASLNADAEDPSVHGIMIERPLPDHVDIHSLMRIVPPLKDVEGLHPINYGLMGLGRERLVGPTPLGSLMLMKHYGIEPEGREVVIIGRSPNVGRPLATLLSQKTVWGNSTVTLVHSRTRDVPFHTRRADIVITAVGKARMLKGDMIREGAVLIDLGINPEGKGIVGDVDMDSVRNRAKMATPTPGGTGPVTVSCVFLNLAKAYKVQKGDLTPFSDPLVSMIYDVHR